MSKTETKRDDDLSVATRAGTMVCHLRNVNLRSVASDIVVIPCSERGHIAKLYKEQFADGVFAIQSMLLRGGSGQSYPLGNVAMARCGDRQVAAICVGTHSFARPDLRYYTQAMKKVKNIMQYLGVKTASVPRLSNEINIEKQIAATANCLQSALIETVYVCDDPAIGKWGFI